MQFWCEIYFFGAREFCFSTFFAFWICLRDAIFQFLGRPNFNGKFKTQKRCQNKTRELQKNKFRIKFAFFWCFVFCIMYWLRSRVSWWMHLWDWRNHRRLRSIWYLKIWIPNENFTEKVQHWSVSNFFEARKFCFRNFFATSIFLKNIVFQQIGKGYLKGKLRLQKSYENKICALRRNSKHFNFARFRWNFHFELRF